MKSQIPKRIIQTGKSRNLPLLEKAAVANVRLLNPDFEYLFFDDSGVEDFIDTEFPQYRGVIDSFPIRIQRYDFFRYLAIYRFGGFYFDLDVLLASNLDDLLRLGCVFPFEELTVQRFLRQEYGMDWEVGNYAFAAAPGHAFVEAIINNCVRAQRNPDWLAQMMRPIPRLFRDTFLVFNTTGPGLVSRTLAEYSDSANPVTVLFPDNVCDAENWHRFGAYGVHLQNGTWRSRSGFALTRLTRLWETATRKVMLKESLALGQHRSVAFKSEVHECPGSGIAHPVWRESPSAD